MKKTFERYFYTRIAKNLTIFSDTHQEPFKAIFSIQTYIYPSKQTKPIRSHSGVFGDYLGSKADRISNIKIFEKST